MQTYFWYANCPRCQQGRLVIIEDVTNDRLYLHCEECEMGWLDPATAYDAANGFLTLLENFNTRNPDLDTIKKRGWEKIAKYSFQS